MSKSAFSNKKPSIWPVVVKYILAAAFAAYAGYLIAINGIVVAGALLALPILASYLIILYKYPKLGVYSVLVLSFILPILGRYVPIGVPFGLGIDGLLVLTYVILILKHWKYFDLALANNSVMLLMLIWMIYIILQILNPQAYSFMAWFYSMRGIALYQLLLIGLGFIIFNSKKDFYNFLNIWLGLSVLGILWAIKQDVIGVSMAEQKWLDDGEALTHVLFGQLRVFSYYYDAGTFGAAMGHSCIVSFILFTGPFSMKRRIIYFLIGIFSFYALMLSGTRGALAVPAIGGMLYLIMIKNTKFLLLGAGVMLAAFVFLKFTMIGQSNYNVNRLRTALDPKDASLNTRFRNRARLSVYLEGKPFGGGVGTSGSWGRRFSPGTWLADFEPDGLYTRIRAETGLMGRIFYVGMWLYILVLGVLWVWKQPHGENRTLAMAMLSGYAGILMANYGNSVLTQFPISITCFLSISFVMVMRKWNEFGEVELKDKPTPRLGRKM